MFRIYLYIVFLLIPNLACAFSDQFDRNVEDLIYQKKGNREVEISELTYDSRDKIAQIKNQQRNVKNITITDIDLEKSRFLLKVEYFNGSSNEISGRFESTIEIPVTSRFIKAGEIITSLDLTHTRANLSKVRGDYIVSEQNLIGMQAKRHLAAGVMIKNNELTRPNVIKVNDPVSIIYTVNNIKLKASGISMGLGAIGDSIKVKNEDTGIVVLGQIINRNTVQVGGE